MYQWYTCVLNIYKLQYYYYLFLYITVLQFKYDYYLFDFQNLDFYDKGKRSRENLFTTFIKFESLSGAYFYYTVIKLLLSSLNLYQVMSSTATYAETETDLKVVTSGRISPLLDTGANAPSWFSEVDRALTVLIHLRWKDMY